MPSNSRNKKCKGKNECSLNGVRQQSSIPRRDTDGYDAMPPLAMEKEVEKKEPQQSVLSVDALKPDSVITQPSLPKLTATFGAAMLSFPWVPPTMGNSRKQLNNEYLMSDSNANLMQKDGGRTGKIKSKSLGSSSRKLYKKSRSTPNSNLVRSRVNTRVQSQKSCYLPFAIPKFNEVHTSWPGFEHEPVPDWEEKYLIAKPYPKKFEDLRHDSISSTRYTSRSSVNKICRSYMNSDDPVDAPMPRRRISVQRVGSCLQ